ncbi:MAG: hypothetical protein E7041_08280 [Lentisphaerae bacterium]|nr:hypothetical protein [Lentisphaerota bacterium]
MDFIIFLLKKFTVGGGLRTISWQICGQRLVEYDSTLPRRCLDLPATLSHNPSTVWIRPLQQSTVFVMQILQKTGQFLQLIYYRKSEKAKKVAKYFFCEEKMFCR